MEMVLPVVLKFRTEGPAYERAKAVADAMNVSVEEYLLTCISEGHKLLRQRYLNDATDYDEPAFIRRGLSFPTLR